MIKFVGALSPALLGKEGVAVVLVRWLESAETEQNNSGKNRTVLC